MRGREGGITSLSLTIKIKEIESEREGGEGKCIAPKGLWRKRETVKQQTVSIHPDKKKMLGELRQSLLLNIKNIVRDAKFHITIFSASYDPENTVKLGIFCVSCTRADFYENDVNNTVFHADSKYANLFFSDLFNSFPF